MRKSIARAQVRQRRLIWESKCQRQPVTDKEILLDKAA